jgi:hypothetical protein
VRTKRLSVGIAPSITGLRTALKLYDDLSVEYNQEAYELREKYRGSDIYRTVSERPTSWLVSANDSHHAVDCMGVMEFAGLHLIVVPGLENCWMLVGPAGVVSSEY